MHFPLTTRFRDRATNRVVVGQVRRAAEHDVFAWTRWRYREADLDKTWDWKRIYLECKDSSGRYECYAASVETELHGLMVLDLKSRRAGESQAIVVDYLASNPLGRSRGHGLKHVGTALMAVAVLRSIECGMAGRIWLECLDGAQYFYESLGLVTEFHKLHEGHLIYTLGSIQAEELLENLRTRKIIDP